MRNREVYQRKRHKSAAGKAAVFIAAVLLGVLGAVGSYDVRAAGDEIYAAGAPDRWPLEYYEDQEYQGILPGLLKEAAQDAGISVRYAVPSKEDNRLKLAEKGQVDLV